jgi:hypothetical protein
MLGLEWDEFELASDLPDPLAHQGLEIVGWDLFCGQGENLKILWEFIKKLIYEAFADHEPREDPPNGRQASRRLRNRDRRSLKGMR